LIYQKKKYERKKDKKPKKPVTLIHPIIPQKEGKLFLE